METVFADLSLGVKGPGLEAIFAYDKGGLESLVIGGRQQLYRCPSLAFWRATTDNDRGNGFSKKSALWMGADMFSIVTSYSVNVDGTVLGKEELRAPGNNRLLDSPLRKAHDVSITFSHATCTSPAAEVRVTYSMSDDWDGVRVSYEYRGVEGLPSLPVCGIRFCLPYVVAGYDWQGLSGETYPDRLAGAQEGHWSIEGLPVTPYVIAQECGMHMGTQLVRFHHKDGGVLTIKAVDGCTINFQALPCSPLELEAAYHPIDLPLPRRTYITIAAAVRGVGGIDSWGSEPGPGYQIDAAGTYHTAFTLC